MLPYNAYVMKVHQAQLTARRKHHQNLKQFMTKMQDSISTCPFDPTYSLNGCHTFQRVEDAQKYFGRSSPGTGNSM